MDKITEVEALLTKEDVCRILGVKESWLNIEIQSGRMPHIRLGKKKMIRFRPSHLTEYLDTREYDLAPIEGDDPPAHEEDDEASSRD
jgi:predicted DNA-binding transcriptional regulator AlpA